MYLPKIVIDPRTIISSTSATEMYNYVDSSSEARMGDYYYSQSRTRTRYRCISVSLVKKNNEWEAY